MYLDETAQVLNQGRAFYIDFLLAHAEKFKETVVYYSNTHLETILHELGSRFKFALHFFLGQDQSIWGKTDRRKNAG